MGRMKASDYITAHRNIIFDANLLKTTQPGFQMSITYMLLVSMYHLHFICNACSYFRSTVYLKQIYNLNAQSPRGSSAIKSHLPRFSQNNAANQKHANDLTVLPKPGTTQCTINLLPVYSRVHSNDRDPGHRAGYAPSITPLPELLRWTWFLQHRVMLPEEKLCTHCSR